MVIVSRARPRTVVEGRGGALVRAAAVSLVVSALGGSALVGSSVGGSVFRVCRGLVGFGGGGWVVGGGDAGGGEGLGEQVEQGLGASGRQGSGVVGAGGGAEGVEDFVPHLDVGGAVDGAGEGEGAVAAAVDRAQFVVGFGGVQGGHAVGVEVGQ